jgi:N-acyl-D-amino-acid deacylase
MRTLVVGIGQPFRRDDGAGLAAASRLSALDARVQVVRCEGDCTLLLTAWAGVDRVVAIDATSSGRPPGTITRLDAATASLPAARHRSSTHALGLADVLDLARVLGQLPPQVVVFGIEGRDFGLGEGLSPEVDRAADAVVAEVTTLIGASGMTSTPRLRTMTGMIRRLLVPVLVLAAGVVVVGGARQPSQPFDLVIRNGRVLDGTGNPWFPADIGVRDGRIVAVGALGQTASARTVDVTGKYVAPGFIDIHSHADDGSGPRGGLRDEDPGRRAAPNLVSQGITTVVVNQDGRSPWPLADQRATLAKHGIGVNAMLLVGHGTVRRRVMGEDVRRPSRPDEVEQMRALVREALSQGAVGLSAGLEYEPGRWSTTEEIVELVRELLPVGGIYISHERSEGSDPLWYVPSQDGPTAPTLLDAVSETIAIGERTGARVVASHLKAKGEHYWGSSAAAVTLIQRARDRGVDVWADQYPYPTSGTDGSTVLIPAWATRPPGGGPPPPGSRAAMLKRVLGDPPTAKLVRSDIAHEIRRRGGAEQITVYDFTDTSLYGKSLADIARLWKLDPVETAIRIQLEGLPDRNGGARMRGFSMSEFDMEHIAKQPWVATSTDGGIALPSDGPATHARFYGSFTRKIRHYAIDRGVISLEHAIRSATSLPARIMRLADRGEIRPGMAADLVVLDLAAVRDKATFFEPHQHSEGIEHVWVNGIAVVENGRLTAALPGRVLGR